MLLLVLFTTVFTTVLSQDTLGVSYYFDSSYKDNFSEEKCGNSTQWQLVSYDYLEINPPYQLSSKAIKALENSCTLSFPIVFFNGTLELTVYVRTVSKYSGITIAVFDDEDNAIEAVRYQRSNKNFVTGWTVVSVPIKQHTTGFIRISGQSLSSELIIIDSLDYIPGNITIFEDTETTQIKKNIVAPAQTVAKDALQIEPLEVEFIEVEGSGGSEEDEDDIDGSGGWETDPPDTEEPGSQTEDPPSTEEPESEEVIAEDLDDPGFWNAFTITFVSVGAFVAIGSIGVGSYYLGKNRGISETPPLDIDVLEAPSVITVPRVRSIFQDAPSERFSRFS